MGNKVRYSSKLTISPNPEQILAENYDESCCSERLWRIHNPLLRTRISPSSRLTCASARFERGRTPLG